MEEVILQRACEVGDLPHCDVYSIKPLLQSRGSGFVNFLRNVDRQRGYDTFGG